MLNDKFGRCAAGPAGTNGEWSVFKLAGEGIG